MAPFSKEADVELVRHAANASRGGTLGPDGPQAELIRRLKNAVENLDKTSTRQQEKMIGLTQGILWLTWVMAIVGLIQAVQIVITLYNK